MIDKFSNDYDDNYDSLDMPSASYTDRAQDPKTFDDYIEFIKLGSQIKENLVKQIERETSTFLLKVLKSILNEQQTAGLLKLSVSRYIYEAVLDQIIHKRYSLSE